MIATIGIRATHAVDLIRSNNKQVRDRCVGASIAITWITHPLIVPKLSQSEIADDF